MSEKETVEWEEERDGLWGWNVETELESDHEEGVRKGMKNLWKIERIRDLWKRVSKDVGWRRARWKPIARLFREERAEEAVVEFLRGTGVGKMHGTGAPREGGLEEQSDEELGGGRGGGLDPRGYPGVFILFAFVFLCINLWRSVEAGSHT